MSVESSRTEYESSDQNLCEVGPNSLACVTLKPMEDPAFRSESRAADLSVLRSHVYQLVLGQIVFAIATVSVWWILQQTRSVPAPLLHSIAFVALALHALTVGGLLAGREWSRFAAAALSLPALLTCAATFAAEFFERDRASYGLVLMTVVIGCYFITCLHTITRATLAAWAARPSRGSRFASTM